jgi:hypothetical protein
MSLLYGTVYRGHREQRGLDGGRSQDSIKLDSLKHPASFKLPPSMKWQQKELGGQRLLKGSLN